MGRVSSVAMREERDCGRKMWRCERAVVMLEGGEFGGRLRRSCVTRRETEKVLSVSRRATQEFWPPFEDGRIAVAISR